MTGSQSHCADHCGRVRGLVFARHDPGHLLHRRRPVPPPPGFRASRILEVSWSAVVDASKAADVQSVCSSTSRLFPRSGRRTSASHRWLNN
jgi:hypothetical protein